MKANFRKLPERQQGSFYSTVVSAAMFGIAANNDMSEMNIDDIRDSLMKTLGINNVKLSGDAVKLVQEGCQEFVDINCETRVPLFHNISGVVSFTNRFEKN